MKVVVLNGSPKGGVSVTMQYVAYLTKKFPDLAFQVLDVAHEIGRLERDPAAWDAAVGSVRSADLVLWAFPLYVLLVPSQYKRFIELVFERDAGDAFAGKYAASLSTSIHYFDQTAHAYLHAICDDLGTRFAGFYSAGMRDLLEEEERARLENFMRQVLALARDGTPVQREHPPLAWPSLAYEPGAPPEPVGTGGKKVVILTDARDPPGNLGKMVARLKAAFAGDVELLSLADVDIRGGCLGCIRCGYDNTCVYHDGFIDFYRGRLQPADIILMAGAVRDRYLSSAWKRFFDRSFFKGHVPGLAGKQVGFVVSGPLGQVPHLREALSAWADNGGCHALFVTDEAGSSGELDGLLDALARRLASCSASGYLPPRTFYAVGGHKIFRDNIYGGMRVPFQADYRYYRAHGLFDFPQRDLKTRVANAILSPLMRSEGFRRKVVGDLR
ncbi:MAG TPA: NAD(P)H-dependent oxidoreductase, partial [Methanomicrobiales archaeon]|nr:NAD(P)H-dependent oxidoreductase [Methanomicrobiales archaeon]